MEPRFKYPKVDPDVFNAMLRVDAAIKGSGLERGLMELVRLRTSMINGCAYCVDMHWKDARAAGETEERLYGLTVWRESLLYSERERAGLEWAEAVTKLSEGHVSDSVFEAVKGKFTDKELVDLTWLVAAMNAWNRMAISMRAVPGVYKAPASGTEHR